MTDWNEEYRRKKTTAEACIRMVKSGDYIVQGHCAGVPLELTAELLAQSERLSDVDVFHMVPIHDCSYSAPEYKGIFRHSTTFAGRPTQKAVNEGRADYVPCFFSELPGLFREKYLPVDIAMISLSPPDEAGFMSFGVSVDYTLQAAESAAIVLAEVNAGMPRTRGSSIHISKIDAFIETDYPPVEIPLPVITEVEEKIGEYIADLIPDGANLQLGIGAIPDAVLRFLGGKKELGIHSEMFSDGVVDLVEKGVITNRYNNLNPGKIIATFLMGSKRLYNFVDNNPRVLMKPVDYTNNPCIAGQLNNLISINSAIEVDLNGQVCADMIGSRQYSGVGGQVDFVRAATFSSGGRSIIAFSSTGKGGSISKIVVRLKDGANVTTSRYDVDTIVTEYGVAQLKGKNTIQRAKSLIAIAHPSFREELISMWAQE